MITTTKSSEQIFESFNSLEKGKDDTSFLIRIENLTSHFSFKEMGASKHRDVKEFSKNI